MDRTYRYRRNNLRTASGTFHRRLGRRLAADSRRHAGSGLVYSRKTAGDDVGDGCHGDVTLPCRFSTHLYN